MGLPLGALIVHEVRLSSGASIKVSQPRDTGAAQQASGTAVTVVPISPRAATVFRID